MGRSKFPGKPSRLASKKRVSVLNTSICVDSSSAVVENGGPGDAGKLSPRIISIITEDNYKDSSRSSSSNSDLINDKPECSDAVAAASSDDVHANPSSQGVCATHTGSVIKVSSPCTSNNNNDNDTKSSVGGSHKSGAECGAIVSQVRITNLSLKTNSSVCGINGDFVVTTWYIEDK